MSKVLPTLAALGAAGAGIAAIVGTGGAAAAPVAAIAGSMGPLGVAGGTGMTLAGFSAATSALASIGGGLAANASGRTEAKYMDYQARAAELEGRRQALVELEQFNRSQARRVAAIGASGIGYSGSPLTALGRAEDDIQTDLELIRAGAAAEAAGIRGQAKLRRSEGTQAVLGGLLSATSTLTGLKLKKRQQQVY